MNAQLHAIAESTSANTFSFMQNWANSPYASSSSNTGEAPVLLTTDTSMNVVRAFELYERRWGIEVIFKECRGYLGLGKCQSRSYNAQIADTTLCFMMYQMLSLAKRFSEYETLGALFRSERDRLQVLTLWSRTLEEVRHLLEVFSREAGVWHAYQL